ncbi:MAG: aquaporin [Candidatus Marinimicrobia bacterium]|nr:aquaporin [Candidatus Neomarinimicrobiota bacterium]|tara:strand:- start:10383 stop:11042 length:660 start_codon:yes stop_codon:yes gene_type:complete
MNYAAQKGLAELIGTFLLTFIGGAAIINGDSGLIGIALAHGLTIALVICSLGHISGAHINPAVTIGFLVTGKIEAKDGLIYILSQLIGAMLAAYSLKVFVPGAMEVSLGGQSISPNVSIVAAIFIEFVLTFFLVTAIYGTAVDDRGTFSAVAGFGIGLVVTVDILAGGPFTGASMNPARSFGPAIMSGAWENQIVYWVGPIIGGATASLFYNSLFMRMK